MNSLTYSRLPGMICHFIMIYVIIIIIIIIILGGNIDSGICAYFACT
jgi:hypothetical protein